MLADQLAKDNQAYSDQKKELDQCKEEYVIYQRNKMQGDSAINSLNSTILSLKTDIKDFKNIESDKNKIIDLKIAELNNLNLIIKDQKKICRNGKAKLTIGGFLIGIVLGILIQSHA